MNKETGLSGKSLEEWRCEIDQLDNELLRLLNQRARIACELGTVKVASRQPAYDGRRERQVLARVVTQNHGPLGAESVRNIFRRIILETRRIGIQAMREQRQRSSAVNHRGKEHRNGH
ncbi:MAG TPA: chorismate mutase [Candidatus Angelobacter sp.]